MSPPDALVESSRIGIVGLGYVGLPLAVQFARALPVTGFDVSKDRIEGLRRGHDRTREVTPEDLLAVSHNLSWTTRADDLRGCNVYVVTVPTPIDRFKRPDLGPLLAAVETVGDVLAAGDVVVFESTVFPGATEDECVPVLERRSGLRFNEDFFVGYSPERVNPGDRTRRIGDVVKVTSGSTPEVAQFVDQLYRDGADLQTYRAESIRVAEAAKVIENVQRDVNIALVNELAMLFCRLGLDTESVLRAAATKWNFLPFQPGLVGGHCIGIDPYYLTQKAEAVGYDPQMILAGRRINDGMGAFVAGRVVKLMAQRGIAVVGSDVLVLGATFKEDCPDLRNSRVVDILRELRSYNVNVHLHDPWADPDEIRREFGVEAVAEPAPASHDALIAAVPHRCFLGDGPEDVRRWLRGRGVVYDVKSALPRGAADERL